MPTQNNLHSLGSIQYFIGYYDVRMNNPANVVKQHIHNEYEIYINISGAVSFVCGDNIYPVESKNVIINRPGEPHHCVYREDVSHKHYYMLFTCDKDEPLLSIFHNREIGVGNLIKLDDEQAFEFLQLCEKLTLQEEEGTLENAYNFIRLLKIVKSGTAGKNSIIPNELQELLVYISHNISGNLCIKDLAALAHMSISTFERQFKAYVGIPPKQYIMQRRLALSSEMLAKGLSVSEACEACGFADYSHFISAFKRRFGVTPLRYRSAHAKELVLETKEPSSY